MSAAKPIFCCGCDGFRYRSTHPTATEWEEYDRGIAELRLGFVPRGEAGAFIAERNTAPGGKLPLNTNGGGLSYMHSGMYGMYALQESVRQMRGTAPAQIPDARISVCHGVGGMFAASGTIIMSHEPP